MSGVRAEADATRAEMDGGDRIDVRFGGNYALVLEETELVRRSLIFNAVVSLIAVLGLYYICYRRVAALLYSSLPLVVGQALTFAVAFFTLDRLSAISVGFTALLMGLGTDFTIVMYARYIEERQAGASLALATERMVGETGIGVFTGVITSAGTFYAMCLSSFRGLWDFGFLMGTGILLCGFAILTMLPAMITWNEGVRRRKVDSLEKLHLQSFGLEHLIPLGGAAPARRAGPPLVLTAAGAWFGRKLGFDDSVQALRSNQTEAAQVQGKVADTFGAALSPMMAIAAGDSVEEALERTAVIVERLRPKDGGRNPRFLRFHPDLPAPGVAAAAGDGRRAPPQRRRLRSGAGAGDAHRRAGARGVPAAGLRARHRPPARHADAGAAGHPGGDREAGPGTARVPLRAPGGERHRARRHLSLPRRDASGGGAHLPASSRGSRPGSPGSSSPAATSPPRSSGTSSCGTPCARWWRG
jgi:hypothetical protein